MLRNFYIGAIFYFLLYTTPLTVIFPQCPFLNGNKYLNYLIYVKIRIAWKLCWKHLQRED